MRLLFYEHLIRSQLAGSLDGGLPADADRGDHERPSPRRGMLRVGSF